VLSFSEVACIMILLCELGENGLIVNEMLGIS
jgi:hypothetical protein